MGYMDKNEQEIILRCIKDMIDAHWIITQSLLKLQRHLEQKDQIT